ncbi:MAG: transposase [Candidatus Aenigmarchaeota archaeon]|nr:transposase [Candidatus Aenigmarchaeota archaeon]
MQTAYKFRLYPTREQEQRLLWTLDRCRYAYNFLLSELQNQKIIDKAQLQEMITDLKRIEPELQKVHSKTLQYENYRLFSNLHALSQLKKNGKKIGRLRFKGKDWFKTFTYNQSGFAIMQNQTRYDKLWLSKIGEIPFIMHRDVEGKIKQITIKHYPSGKWYASIIAETKDEIPKTENKDKVGIDLGTINYAYDSNGNHFDNPKHLDKSLKKLRKEQRRLSIKKKGSDNRQKCSNCGKEVPKKLWNRIHKCSCGLEIDRDYNSAMNILKRALESLPPERRESTPVETEPLLKNDRRTESASVNFEQVWSEKQEAPCDSWE